MRKGLLSFILTLSLLAVVFVGIPVLADEFTWDINPRIGLNPTDGFRLGGTFVFNNLLGQDEFKFFGDYGFKGKRFHGGYDYKFDVQNNRLYTSGYSDFFGRGIYKGETLWQAERLLNAGISRAERSGDDYYFGDFCLEYTDRAPQNNAGGILFDTGKDLTLKPTIFGSYGTYTGKVDLTYGMNTSVSDYNYLKGQVFLKKMFNLSSTDRISIAGEIGAMRGNYPAQQKFFLGSSENNFAPHFKAKFLSSMAGMVFADVYPPVLYLDGYDDNAFGGENMYVSKVEYQHRVLSVLDGTFRGFGKVYAVAGNAWTGSLSEGFKTPHAAIGVGFNMESAIFSAPNHEWFLGLNLAHGFGPDAALTVGIETGFNFSMNNTLFSSGYEDIEE